MIENYEGNDDDPSLEKHTEEIAELIGGEEGGLFAKQEELRYELGSALEDLLSHVSNAYELTGMDPSDDPQDFVDANLTAPEDSPLRAQLIEALADQPRAREFLRLLQEMDTLVRAED